MTDPTNPFQDRSEVMRSLEDHHKQALGHDGAYPNDQSSQWEDGINDSPALKLAINMVKAGSEYLRGEGQKVLTISDAEHATILAALRFWQANGQGDPANRRDEFHEIATNGDEVISLDDNAIDALCERINC